MRVVFLLALVISLVAAIASLLRGKRVYADEEVRGHAKGGIFIARIAFWITAGPEMREKALAGLRLAARLAERKAHEVRVFLYGPGVHLADADDPELEEAFSGLGTALIPVGACPVNVARLGADQAAIANKGVQLDEHAVDAIVAVVEEGYQVIGI